MFANLKVDHLEVVPCRLMQLYFGHGEEGIVFKMVDIEFIRKKHLVDGWSIRKISRQLGVARQTVSKALLSAEPPRYNLSQPRPCPVMDPQTLPRWHHNSTSERNAALVVGYNGAVRRLAVEHREQRINMSTARILIESR